QRRRAEDGMQASTASEGTKAKQDRGEAKAKGPVIDTAFGGLAREHGYEPVRVEGTVPPELRGTFYRNGPAVFDAGVSPHWFDGTGAIAAVRFDGRGAEGAVRTVRTPSVAHDQGRARTRFGAFGQP